MTTKIIHLDEVKKVYSALNINKMRENSKLVLRNPSDEEEAMNDEGCWIKSSVNFSKYVSSFPSLRLKKGFVIQGYIIRTTMDGFGVLWAVPADIPYLQEKILSSQSGLFSQNPLVYKCLI